jgi:hypothetical protein
MPGAEADIERASSSTGLQLLAARAALALARGSAPEASGLAARALQQLAAKGSPEPLLRDAFTIAARAALAASDAAGAWAHAQSALARARAEAIDVNSSSSVGEALLLEAQVLAQQGQLARAAALARDALAHLQENLGPAHPLTRQAQALAQS